MNIEIVLIEKGVATTAETHILCIRGFSFIMSNIVTPNIKKV